MDNLAIDLPQEVETQSLAIPERAQAIVINSSRAMVEADYFKKAIKGLIKEIDLCFEPLASKAFQAHRAITAKWKETKQPLIDADSLITAKAKAYLREEENKRIEEERRLREIARKQEEERRLDEAIELEREGNKEEAQAMLDEPIVIITPVVQSSAPKLDNRMYRKNWKWRIVDMDKIPREYMTTNDVAINGLVRSLKGACKIDGIEVYEE
uniref:Uncharacterized protein n=1 Tax=viral metagenome TaxID=1070528 RepID=A0A6M3K273_9ZZZZ